MTKAELKDDTQTGDADLPLIAGRYLTHARIGHGRLGEIFVATDEGDEKAYGETKLAIQIVPESVVSNNRLFNRFNVGYGQLRAWAHPNIVKYLDFGRYRKRGYLVMERLEGAPLRVVLEDAETLSIDAARPIIYGIGEALRLLHAEDLVHGNLTTSNVFITGALKARLLDVLPVDPSDPIIRGGATSDPFGRSTVADDVFGLACLAYEMLAGKHPFDTCSLEEARLAGLEAERIDSLTDGEWQALRHALSFDREQRTASVGDFMRDFGNSDTSNAPLKPDQEPAPHEHIVYPAMEETPQITRPDIPLHNTVTTPPVADVEPVGDVEPVVVIDPVTLDANRSTTTGRIRKRHSSWRAVFLGILLAALGTWIYFGQPQEQVERLISYIDANVDTPLPLQRDTTEQSPLPAPVESVATDGLAPVGDLAVEDTAVDGFPIDNGRPVDEPPVVEPAVDDLATAASVEDSSVDSNETYIEIEPAAVVDTDVAAVAQSTVQELTQPEMGFAESVVSVSERDGAARIILSHIDNSTTPLIWWTSEHSASAGTDFIAVDQQTVPNLSAADGSVLLVPLVNDSLPEPLESFFVSLGMRHPELGRIERIDTVRVDIIDDD